MREVASIYITAITGTATDTAVNTAVVIFVWAVLIVLETLQRLVIVIAVGMRGEEEVERDSVGQKKK